MPQKIIIDTDPGIGDAIAIALAIFDPDVDVVGITATAGCVDAIDATRNVQAIVERLDPPKWPRLGESQVQQPQMGRTEGLAMTAPPRLSGEHGMGDWVFAVSDLHNRRESAKVMVDLVRDDPHQITLLTLGPLTNVELACERAPEFLSLLKGIVCLGGSVREGGDVTAAAEFNIYSNPVAARGVLLSPATKTLVPLDASCKPVLTFEQYRRLTDADAPQSVLRSFLEEILPYYFLAHHEQIGCEGVRLQEVTALCAIARPHLFETRAMAMDIETGGHLARGMTIFDRRGTMQWQTNIDVLVQVDKQGVVDYVTQIVTGAARFAEG